MSLYKWSKTAASDATADPSINWAEGMAPSGVNDSGRAMMAATAKYRDDTSGSIVTGGTSTAYTLSSNQGFTSKALMDGAEIAFTISATNGASPTLNVDSLGADPITLDGVVPVPAGTLIAGSIYTAMYYASGTAWRLKDFYQLPFTIPIGGMIDFFGTSYPSSNFVFAFGQAISRTTYSALFSMFGTSFGTGDGSTTFNIPDIRGRVVAGKDDMGGTFASRLDITGGMSGTGLGSVGGVQIRTLFTANLPPYTPSGTIGTVTVTSNRGDVNVGSSNTQSGGGSNTYGATTTLTSTGAGPTFTGTPQGGSGSAFQILQPTIIANKLLRII